MDQQTPDLNEYASIIKRRKYYFILPFVVVFVAAAVIAFTLPPLYKSTCTILIEDQQIPPEFARSTVTTAVDQTIETITQRVMIRAKLQEIIDRFNLYPERRGKETSGEIIRRMRKDIRLDTVSADVTDRRTGRSSIGTIAFNLSYEGSRPDHVQTVANVLASLYLEQNVKYRQEKARSTSSFLEAELESTGERIDSLETQVADFKQKHFHSLPEMSQLNLQMVQRLEQELTSLNQQAHSIKERKIYLEGQLATVSPDLPGIKTEDGKYANAGQRLEYLTKECISLQASLTDKHPDIIKVKKEIEALEKEVGIKGKIKIRQNQLAKMEADLASKKATLSTKHPDIIKLEKSVKILKRELDALVKIKPDTKDVLIQPANPAYINLRMQIVTAEMDLRNLKRNGVTIKERLEHYLKRLELAPMIEKEYQLLTRDYENARIRYQETLSKLMEAKTAEGLESSQKGQRFTIIDPAVYPEKPFKPNRVAITLIGFILGLGGGVGLASIKEFSDQSVWSESSLRRLTDKPVLAVIPIIETDDDLQKRRRKIVLGIIILVVFFVLFLLAIHLFYKPLDILWLKVYRKILM